MQDAREGGGVYLCDETINKVHTHTHIIHSIWYGLTFNGSGMEIAVDRLRLKYSR